MRRVNRYLENTSGIAAWLELLAVAGGVLVAWQLGVQQVAGLQSQLDSLKEDLASSSASALHEQQEEIGDIFLQKPHLMPYFWDDVRPPAADTKVRQEAKAAALRLLDHFEHLRYMMDRKLIEADREAWTSHIKGSFRSSPILCDTLWTYKPDYGGTNAGHLWTSYASQPCNETSK